MSMLSKTEALLCLHRALSFPRGLRLGMVVFEGIFLSKEASRLLGVDILSSSQLLALYNQIKSLLKASKILPPIKRSPRIGIIESLLSQNPL